MRKGIMESQSMFNNTFSSLYLVILKKSLLHPETPHLPFMEPLIPLEHVFRSVDSSVMLVGIVMYLPRFRPLGEDMVIVRIRVQNSVA